VTETDFYPSLRYDRSLTPRQGSLTLGLPRQRVPLYIAKAPYSIRLYKTATHLSKHQGTMHTYTCTQQSRTYQNIACEGCLAKAPAYYITTYM